MAGFKPYMTLTVNFLQVAGILWEISINFHPELLIHPSHCERKNAEAQGKTRHPSIERRASMDAAAATDAIAALVTLGHEAERRRHGVHFGLSFDWQNSFCWPRLLEVPFRMSLESPEVKTTLVDI